MWWWSPILAALHAALRSTLVDAHFEPLLGRLHARVHVGRRTLWGSVASAWRMASPASRTRCPGSTLATAHEVLSLLDVDDLVDLAPASTGAGLDIHRRTCCLAFTLPEPKICTAA
jgi:ferric iron reductase protein FhuF